MAGIPAGSVVYVIGNADNRLVKIGTTSQSKLERMSGIQTMSPSILTVLWTTTGDEELEHKLHYEFRAERRHGEWFDFGDRDPVATVAPAATRLKVSMRAEITYEELHPTELLWRALENFDRWCRHDANPEERNAAPDEVGYAVLILGEILSSLHARAVNHPGRVPEATAALQLATQCLNGITYPDTVGMPSPRTAIAMAANTHWLAKCLAGAIEDDPFALYAPEHIADFTREASGAIRQLVEAIGMSRLGLKDAETRGDVPRGAQRALGYVIEEIFELSGGLTSAAKAVREIPYRGYVDRGESALFEAMVDELEARGTEPEIVGPGMRVDFTFHFEHCSLELTNGGWTAYLRTQPHWRCKPLGATSGAAHHPGQIVSSALRYLDKEIGPGPYPVEPDHPRYVANPNWGESDEPDLLGPTAIEPRQANRRPGQP